MTPPPRFNFAGHLFDLNRERASRTAYIDDRGTLAQIRGIAARVGGCELLEIPECGHSPHRDQPDRVIVAATSFITKNRRETS